MSHFEEPDTWSDASCIELDDDFAIADPAKAGAALIAPGSRRGETLRPEIYVCISTINRPGPMMFMTRVRL